MKPCSFASWTIVENLMKRYDGLLDGPSKEFARELVEQLNDHWNLRILEVQAECTKLREAERAERKRRIAIESAFEHMIQTGFIDFNVQYPETK